MDPFLDVRLICGILDVNSFEITTAQGESSSIQAVYRSSSLAEHRCVPNLHRTFEISTLEICLRAMQPITAGTHLTITYTDSLWYESMHVMCRMETFKFPLLQQLIFPPHQTFHITTPLELDFGSVQGLVIHQRLKVGYPFVREKTYPNCDPILLMTLT